RVTRLFGDSRDPVFSGDGKYLAFSCSEEGEYDIYRINLIDEDQDFAEDKFDKVIKAKEKKAKSDDKKDGEKKDDEKTDDAKPDAEAEAKEEPKARVWKDVEIDFEDIHQRVR